MSDEHESHRRASQPLVMPSARTHKKTLFKTSSFFFAGLNALRPRTKRSENESVIRLDAQQDSSLDSIQRISVVSRSSDYENVDNGNIVAEVLSNPAKHRDRVDELLRWDAGSDINTGDETDDAEISSSGKSSVHLRNQHAPTTKAKTSQATVMYSISFYPWKMEPHCYYSHPEAAANWVPDTASTRCQICLAAFTLMRRRHHCRLCGHLACANCSHDRTYLPFAGSAPSQHRLIKDGAPQRTCSACASTLRNMAGQDDPRVKRFTVAVSSARRRKPVASVMSKSLPQSVVKVEVERPSPWLRRTGLAFTDSDMEDEDSTTASTKALQLDQCARESTHHMPLRLLVTPAEELDEILNARTSSLVHSEMNPRGNLGSRQFVISSAWLKLWLRYVRVDPASAESDASTRNTTRLSYQSYRNGARKKKSTAKCQMAGPPRPGPVANYILLDFVNGELVSKPNLERSRGSHVGGDFRIVSQEVWVSFLHLYGGGPNIQVSLSNDIASRKVAFNDQSRLLTRPQWIVSELDDSLPAMAASPSIKRYSPASRKGVKFKTIRNASTNLRPRPRSASRKRLVLATSIPSLGKKRTGRCFENDESPHSRPHSRWKLREEGGSKAQSKTRRHKQTSAFAKNDAKNSVIDGSQSSTRDTSSPLAAVSAFANAATLARQRSAKSLLCHSARTNGEAE
ncbi:hypothetical protein KXD40_001014 [Peronospora effusa]|uniref:FYVE-type domain-containing protein n=1 Tax=Peronospora effusa TaxID=542832 RepID=A0A3M6VM02_9STRA|nr:hypothetical protein DD238_000733 [Peronospora effusa]RQM17628.1 hypothetical protein DD237_001620 [Peronospora effusa]UIZ21232.1 hypothetical protein KXD40_001014 [Peronospora effusa]CAI5724221.1 unnamed protein product [Peronospora effusa]